MSKAVAKAVREFNKNLKSYGFSIKNISKVKGDVKLSFHGTYSENELRFAQIYYTELYNKHLGVK